MSEVAIDHNNLKQYQSAVKRIMTQTPMENPVFVTIRMKQVPVNGLPKLTTFRAYKNNTDFLNFLHKDLLGNNWQRRYKNGLQRFVVVENSESVGVHTHMIIDTMFIDINRFKEAAYAAYKRTPYSGQPYKHFTDGNLIDIKPIFSHGILEYLIKAHTKPEFDQAIDFINSYWTSK